MALGPRGTRQLGLPSGLALFDDYVGETEAVPVPVLRQSPSPAGAPSWLSDAGFRTLQTPHSSDDTGHGGEQRALALARRHHPQVETTRAGVRESTGYCADCQRKSQRDRFDVPHSSTEDPLLSTTVADLRTTSTGDGPSDRTAILAVVDLRSRYVFPEEAEDYSAEGTVVRLVKVGGTTSLKDCILRTGPGASFTAAAAQDLLKLMRASWRVGVAGSHVEQARTERAPRELSSRTRPAPAGVASRPGSSTTRLRLGSYLAARTCSSSKSHLGFCPSEVLLPSETSDLQAACGGGTTAEGRSGAARQLLDAQQEVLSAMLTAQELEYDRRPSEWTAEGRLAWDELLRLGTDDYVLVNCPGRRRLNSGGPGPHRVTRLVDRDYSVEVQSLVDSSTVLRVRANRLVRPRHDPRSAKAPQETLPEDTGSAQVLRVPDHDLPGGGQLHSGLKGQGKELVLQAQPVTGVRWPSWEEVRQLEALDRYLDTGPFSRGLAAQLRTKDKRQRVTGPLFTPVWKEQFDSAYTAGPDGTELSEADVSSTASTPTGGSPSEAAQIRSLLHEFGCLFQPRQKGQLLNCPKTKCVEESPGASACGRRWECPRPTSGPRALEACCKVLQELEDQGTTERIDPEKDPPEWSAPTSTATDRYAGTGGVRTPKYRLCTDSRGANCRKESEPFPPVSVESVFKGLAGMPHQSQLDLPRALPSLEVDEDSRRPSSSTRPATRARYWPNGMVMGDVSSPSHFQTFMQRTFREDEPYTGDLAWGDKTFSEHPSRPRGTLQKCRDSSTSLSAAKCKFNMSSLKVLGRVTDKAWRAVDDGTTGRAKGSARPGTVRQVTASCGLVNWMREFLPDLGAKMQPFYALTKLSGPDERMELEAKSRYRCRTGQRTPWTPELEASFLETKEYCSNPQKLHFINPLLPIFVNTDASLKGRGGVLYQLDPAGSRCTCGTRSGSWNKVQAKWPTVEQEAYATYRTVLDFEAYLIGRSFTLCTDSKGLTFPTEGPSRKIQRWRLALQMFTFTTIHIAGELNVEADTLSRISLYDDDQ